MSTNMHTEKMIKQLLSGNKGVEADKLLMDPPIRSKQFTWPQLNAGDDQMNAGSTMTLWSNGTGRFDATTQCFSTHSGDVWHHTILVYDPNGTYLFSAG